MDDSEPTQFGTYKQPSTQQYTRFGTKTQLGMHQDYNQLGVDTQQQDWATGQQHEEEESEDNDPDDFCGDSKKRDRGESFNILRDELLCDAWLASSLELIHGTEQKGTTFCKNIHIWFHEHKHFAPYSDAVIRNGE